MKRLQAMSTIAEKLRELESLRRAIASHGNLTQDVLRRIEYRFRLECNYFSNKMEGGTLTRKETRSVMIGNISVDNKPFKDIAEMKGHDAVMLDILRIGKGELNISERRIKDMHKAIIVEESPALQDSVGNWKKEPNYIINARHERFDFLPPNEVPEAMHHLLNWLNAALEKIQRMEKNAPNPVLIAFEFHLRFLSIHPFLDGNGRTARLLSNLILVANNYPPFFINDAEKDIYNRYLSDIQGYGGNPDQYYEFMSGLLLRSLQLTLDIIEGRETGQS
jgi:Fic family protein